MLITERIERRRAMQNNHGYLPLFYLSLHL
nr:MAG TPA: hypothetical protein [Caudoviricetes sp.]